MEGRWCPMGCTVKDEMDLEGLHRCLLCYQSIFVNFDVGVDG